VSMAKRILCMTLLMFLAVVAVVAQDAKQEAKKEAQLRTVHGLVLDKSEDPISESVVYLKNVRNNIVRTLYTDSSGKYRFSGLDPNTDYEIFAQKNDLKSTTRTVTSYDSRKDIELNLKIDRKKE
jgi:Carboxypeptidase regulatory-like domain